MLTELLNLLKESTHAGTMMFLLEQGHPDGLPRRTNDPDNHARVQSSFHLQ